MRPTDVVRGAAARLGLEVRRHRPRGIRRAETLRRHGVRVVLDVGANTGQYGAELRRSGWAGRMISFEPVASAYVQLERRARQDAAWETHRLALGDTDTEEEIQVASNLASSSFLPMLESHRKLDPTVSMVDTEVVQMRRLDSLQLATEGPVLLKLDVQGYEDRVLRGAEKTLEVVQVIECELCVVPLYDAQLPLDEMLVALHAFGFRLEALEPAGRDAEGATPFYDGTFTRGASRA